MSPKPKKKDQKPDKIKKPSKDFRAPRAYQVSNGKSNVFIFERRGKMARALGAELLETRRSKVISQRQPALDRYGPWGPVPQVAILQLDEDILMFCANKACGRPVSEMEQWCTNGPWDPESDASMEAAGEWLEDLWGDEDEDDDLEITDEKLESAVLMMGFPDEPPMNIVAHRNKVYCCWDCVAEAEAAARSKAQRKLLRDLAARIFPDLDILDVVENGRPWMPPAVVFMFPVPLEKGSQTGELVYCSWPMHNQIWEICLDAELYTDDTMRRTFDAFMEYLDWRRQVHRALPMPQADLTRMN